MRPGHLDSASDSFVKWALPAATTQTRMKKEYRNLSAVGTTSDSDLPAFQLVCDRWLGKGRLLLRTTSVISARCCLLGVAYVQRCVNNRFCVAAGWYGSIIICRKWWRCANIIFLKCVALFVIWELGSVFPCSELIIRVWKRSSHPFGCESKKDSYMQSRKNRESVLHRSFREKK